MAIDFLELGPTSARATTLLAHGAGAPMALLDWLKLQKR